MGPLNEAAHVKFAEEIEKCRPGRFFFKRMQSLFESLVSALCLDCLDDV